ncbi:MAG: hypothetical protein WC933_03295 [Candidatus Paceibacterota bacterium]|jgi:hypothetical protein
MTLKLLEFIKNNSNWESLLKEKPYALAISRLDDFILFKYNQIDSDPRNEIVKESRGIIFHEPTWTPVCVPFFRFYNVQEEYADKIDWESAKVLSKIDGSLTKFWFFDNKWHLSTNGTIDAFQCTLQSNILCPYTTFGELFLAGAKVNSIDEFAKKYFLDKTKTYMFELVSPFNRIVVPYSEPDIYHIGTRDNISLLEEDIDLGIQKPKQYNFNSLDDCIAASKDLPFSEEGYVVVDKNFFRNKIKSIAYILCHRLRGESFSNKRAFELFMSGEHLEFLSYFPEYLEYFNKIQYQYDKIFEYFNTKQKELDNTIFLTQKEFALHIKNFSFSSYFFMKRSGKINSIYEYIKKIPIDSFLTFTY